MPTVIVSDLHLGSRASTLGTPAVRDRLLGELHQADEVILLGDVLSLRGGPVREVLSAAQSFLRSLGEAMARRRVVIVPGNHDHALVDPLPASYGGEPSRAGLETTWTITPEHPEPLATIASWLPDCELTVAYPGVWVRPDVYATHGHYLDCHLTVPRIETLCAAAMQTLAIPLPGRPSVEDYEAVLAPMYAFANARAQSRPSNGSEPVTAMSRTLRGLKAGGLRYLVSGVGSDHSGTRARARRRGIVVLAAAGVMALNRAGLGRFSADLSADAIRRAGRRAMAEVVAGLRIEAQHVVFGHTHAAGPLRGEAPWRLSTGTQLTNAGNWVYEPALISSADASDPYWPGTCVVVPEHGDPELRPLLAELAATPIAE